MFLCGKISWLNFSLTILTIENLDFGRSHGRNFDILAMVFNSLLPSLALDIGYDSSKRLSLTKHNGIHFS